MNTIKYHDIFEAIYDGGEKGRNLTNSLISPELRQGFTGTYRYSVGRLL